MMTNFSVNVSFRERAKRDDSSAKNGFGASTANEDKDKTTREMIVPKVMQPIVCFPVGSMKYCKSELERQDDVLEATDLQVSSYRGEEVTPVRVGSIV